MLRDLFSDGLLLGTATVSAHARWTQHRGSPANPDGAGPGRLAWRRRRHCRASLGTDGREAASYAAEGAW